MTDRDHTSLPSFDLMNFVPYRLSVVAQVTSEDLAKEYRQRFGITTPQWRVLVHLAHSGEKVSVREIESQIVMEKSKVSRAATKLESIGYIEKRINPNDRRLVCLTLTPKGEELMAHLLPLAKAYQERIEKMLGSNYASFMSCVDLLSKETSS